MFCQVLLQSCKLWIIWTHPDHPSLKKQDLDYPEDPDDPELATPMKTHGRTQEKFIWDICMHKQYDGITFIKLLWYPHYNYMHCQKQCDLRWSHIIISSSYCTQDFGAISSATTFKICAILEHFTFWKSINAFIFFSLYISLHFYWFTLYSAEFEVWFYAIAL